jgi:GT2 family glycosyltransferase
VTPAEAGSSAGPAVTVSLVTYDGADWLPGCLAALAAQDLADYELLIWDNASHDGSLGIAGQCATQDPRTRVFSSPANLGYAAAHNRNIAEARADVVLLLNQDVELDPGFLTAGVAALAARPDVGSVQGRLRQLGAPGERLQWLDTTGLQMGRDRRAVSRAQGQHDGPGHATPGPVWGADGPAPMYRATALRDARLPRHGGAWEVLDEDFFLYKEDVDLAWRLGALGWGAWYEPEALAWHARGTGGTGATSLLDIARTNRTIRHEAKALSWRNQRLMQIKNEVLLDYLRDAPWIMRRELLSLAFISLFDPRRLSAVVALLRLAPAAMRKRRYLRARLKHGSVAGRRPRPARP